MRLQRHSRPSLSVASRRRAVLAMKASAVRDNRFFESKRILCVSYRIPIDFLIQRHSTN